MERLPLITKDGSHTISIPEMKVTYHSLHGAIGESTHVFIEAGLAAVMPFNSGVTAVLEVGFGTGLNALLTLIEAEKQKQLIYYDTIELYPLTNEEIKQLNYCHELQRPDLQPVFERLHNCEWEKSIAISEHFILYKKNIDFAILSGNQQYDLIYYDAFAPSAQPELWTQPVFEKLYRLLLPGGMLVTYCSKSVVQRAMKAAGFIIEKIPGPWGKREMVRAIKSVG